MRERHEAVWWTEAVQMRNGALLPIATSFHYTSRDPYAARIVFHPDPERHRGVSWYVERDLLAAGMRCRAGVGEVQVRPAPGPPGGGQVMLQIGPPAGRAVFLLDAAGLREWLAVSYTLVPPGCESDRVDWRPLERLLSGRA
ncbi:SsgA family sporulation/cell division regulator [Streptomyces sp. NPDC019507]|uniref:SsgA family sporulation/cell division regulator n=1 Tax=Streptomyces sp. NPDC019507 TaxID=3154689 RepID=UPI0033E0E232